MNIPCFTLLSFLFLFAVIGNAQNRQPADSLVSQTQGTSTVSGRVLYTDGQPMKNVKLRIFQANSDAGRGGLLISANERGEFQVTGLAAGKYYVSLVGAGSPQPSGMGMRLPLPISAIPGPNDYPEIIPKHDAQFTVDGTNAIDIEIKIVRGGLISGRVLRSNGEAVAEAAITVLSREGGAGPYMARFSTRTDKNGNFRIENLPPTDYVVSAATERQGNFDMLARIRGDGQIVTYHPAARRLSDALPVKVDSGRESGGVNVTLVSRKAFSVSGSVVRGRDGSPLVGAHVILRNKETDMTGPLVPGMMQRTTETGPDGKWSFSNVEEGEYQIAALDQVGGSSKVMMSPRRPGEPPVLNDPRPGPRPRFLIAQQDVNLIGAKVEGLVLTINGSGSIRGVVESEDGTSLPSNLILFFEFSNDALRPGRPIPVRVEADGSFVLNDVQAGDTYLMPALQSGAKHFIASAQINGKDLTGTPVKVIEGAESGPISVRLSDRFATLGGRVVGGNGASNGSVILLIPADPQKQRFRTTYTAVQVMEDGTFFTRVAPGEYVMLARNREQMPPIVTPDIVRDLAPNLPRVDLKAGDQKSVQVKLGP